MTTILRSSLHSLLSLLALPLAGQTWDIRLEVPSLKGQSLPSTMLSGTSQLISGELDTGNGGILSVSHRLIRISPVFRIEWGGELTSWQTNGHVALGHSATFDTQMKQAGFGLGINAQMWVPFTGLCAEMGAIQRLHHYKGKSLGEELAWKNTKTWLRVGIRWRLPISTAVHPYITASYQQPITKDQQIQIDSIKDIVNYFREQGAGQEFNRLWTFGLGIAF